MILSSHANWIFLCFIRGSYGHVLSRCLLTSPDTLWYDHPANGGAPWRWNHFPIELGIGVSPGHYLKFYKKGDSKSPKDRVEMPTLGTNMNLGGHGDFNQPWVLELLNHYKIIYSCHDDPAHVRQHFPNAKIIMVDIDPDNWAAVVANQIQATGNYPAMGAFDANHDKQQWRKKTNQNSMRDWEKWSNNLTDEEWVVWTSRQMQEEDRVYKQTLDQADAVFSTKDRWNKAAIIQLHKDVGLTPDPDGIQRVLDAFNWTRLL